MPVIRDIVTKGLISYVTNRSQRESLAGIGFVILAGLLMVPAAVFGSLAAYTGLEQIYSPSVAFAVIAGVLLLIGSLVLLIGLRILKKKGQSSVEKSYDDINKLIELISDDFLKEISVLIQENPKAAMMAAIISGFVIGEKIPR